MLTFTALEWVLLVTAALAIGVTKTALPSLGTVPVALFAAVMPARLSTGAVLTLLIVGDVVAISLYHMHADWAALRKLLPSVLVGVVAGFIVLVFVDDGALRRIIGAILIFLVLLNAWPLLRRRFRRPPSPKPPSPHLSVVYGPLGGFTTMVANAAGPVMSMYFLATRFPVAAFLGTAAWFFFVINVVKLPFSVGLGLVTVDSLVVNLILLPALLVGAWLGVLAARRFSQRTFTVAIMALTVASGVYLLV